MTRCARLLLAGSTLLGEACSGAPVNLGQSPEMLWWTDHETGDLSDWTRDGGGTWTVGGGTLDLVSSPVRSGRYALRSMVTTSSSSVRSAGIGVRSALMPSEACYSAWFFLPAPIQADGFWLFFKFRSRQVADQASTDVDTWDLDVVKAESGDLLLSLYRHDREEATTAQAPSVPIGRWFQLEACLLAASDEHGRLAVWLDGQVAFELNAQATMPSPYVEWNVGSVAQGIAPSSASLYIDDAAISTRRLGPDFPVFWRAP